MSDKLINEMALGMGGMADGPPPEEKMAEGAYCEDDLDLGPPEMDELGGDEDELEEDECVECDKGDLRRILDAVEMGEKSADEAFEELCDGGGADLDDDEGFGGEGFDELDDEGFGECMESVRYIASMLTDDPDIMSEADEKPKAKRKKCPECGKVDLPPSISMCRKCDQKLRTPPPPSGGPKKKKKELEDTDA